MDILKLDSVEILELIRKEIEEIKSIKVPFFVSPKGFEDIHEDYQLFEEPSILSDKMVDHNLMMKELKASGDEEQRFSEEGVLSVDKIEGYNNLIDNITHSKTNLYYDYFDKISNQIKQNKSAIEIMQNSEFIGIELKFYIDNKQKDLDNISYGFDEVFSLFNFTFKENKTKGIIDSISKTSKINDVKIYEINTKKKIIDKGEKEYIKYRVFSIPRSIVDRD